MDLLTMDPVIEKILVYGLVVLFCAGVVIIYLHKQKRESKSVEDKIKRAKKEGLYEPVSLHPVIASVGHA